MAEPTFSLEIRRFLLLSLMDRAAKVVPGKEVMPVLRNFQMEATTDRLRISASDLELSVIGTTDMVKVTTPGTVVVPAKKMQEIINAAAGDDVLLDVVDGTATIVCGKARWTLKLDDGATWPKLPNITDLQEATVDRVRFLGAIKAVYRAASTDANRANCAMVDITNGRMTATDGTRVQQAMLGEDFDMSIQIPIQAVPYLISLLNTSDLNTIGVGESENHIVFRVGSDLFIANKLMVRFANIEQTILAAALRNTEELHVDREELLNVIKRVRINADDSSNAIQLKLSTDSLLAVSRDKMGNTCEEVVAAGWKGPDRLIVVNYKYFEQMVEMYDGRSCRFLLGEDLTKNKRSPLLLKDADTGALGVVQQMRPDFTID